MERAREREREREVREKNFFFPSISPLWGFYNYKSCHYNEM
jgi:hypothetical protein